MVDRLCSARLRRGLVLFLALGALALPACDSDGDGNINRVSGTYVFTQLRFDTAPSAVAEAEVLDRVQSSTVEFVPDNAEFRGRIEFENDQGRTSVFFLDGTYSVRGNQVRLDIDQSDEANRRRLLLPDQFRLDIQSEGNVLARAIQRESVDLSAFSEEQFGGGLGTVNGTLQVRLER